MSLYFLLGEKWVPVNNEPSISTHYKITNLNTGDKILARVKAISKAGCSDPTHLEHDVLIREIVGKTTCDSIVWRFTVKEI